MKNKKSEVRKESIACVICLIISMVILSIIGLLAVKEHYLIPIAIILSPIVTGLWTHVLHLNTLKYLIEDEGGKNG